jgi:Rrf2 family protein
MVDNKEDLETMLTQTSEIAIKSLIYLGLKSNKSPIPPYEIAEKMGCSSSYLAKVMGQLVKAGILRSYRGPQGGMTLAKEPEDINLLEIVEAVQGLLIALYCKSIGDDIGPVCSFHKAMWDVHNSMTQALRRWTLADLMKQPLPTGELADNDSCIMRFLEKEM